MSFSLFNFHFCQQSSRMFGFDSEKKNFLCFSRITKHREISGDSLLIMNHQKFREIEYEKKKIISMRALQVCTIRNMPKPILATIPVSTPMKSCEATRKKATKKQQTLLLAQSTPLGNKQLFWQKLIQNLVQYKRPSIPDNKALRIFQESKTITQI